MYSHITDKIEGLRGLKLEEIMPSAYLFMLHRGKKYETGSDYSIQQLRNVIYKCHNCRGTGYYMVANGEDDVDQEWCEFCDGLGTYLEGGVAL